MIGTWIGVSRLRASRGHDLTAASPPPVKSKPRPTSTAADQMAADS
jgi:hypothetical protein